MSKSFYQDVQNFLNQHGVPCAPVPDMPDKEVQEFALQHLDEELTELSIAFYNEDIVEIADALGDIVFVTLNLAARMCLPMDEIWQAICKANSAPGKRKAQTEDESKRGYIHDVIKTEHFVSPEADIKEILMSKWGHDETA